MLRLLRMVSVPQLRASWGRTLLVVGGIATGITLIVAIRVINGSILTNVQRTIDLVAGAAELEVTLGVGEVGFPESTLAIVRKDPDVAAAVPLVRGTISLASDPAHTLQLFGADLLTEDALGRYDITVGGERRSIAAALADARSVLLTTEFVRPRGLTVGDTVMLSTPRGVETFTIRGVLAPKGPAAAFGDALAVMDLAAAQHYLAKDDRIDQIDVVLRPEADRRTVEARLGGVLAGFTVAPPLQRGALYDRIFGSFQAMLTGVSLLCLVAGVFIIYNTTATAALQRSVAMAALRLVGAERRQLWWLAIMEAAGLGVVGVLAGIPLGIALGWVLAPNVAASMGVIFQLRVPARSLTVDVGEQAVIAMVGVTAAVLASSFAAWRMARLDPLDAIRADPTAPRPTVATGRLVVGWLALLAISAGALVLEVRTKSIAWGNLGSTLWNGSVLVIAVPVVAWLGGALSTLLPRWFRAEGRIAAASLFRSPTRTGVTVAAVALVLTIGVTVASLSLSHRSSIRRYFDGGFLASDLVVSAVATEGGWLEAPIPETLVAEVAGVPGVRSAEAFRVLPGQMFRGARIAIAGGSPGFFAPERFGKDWYVAGDPATAGPPLQAGSGVTVSASLADIFGLVVGSTVELESPTGPLTRPVVGIVPDYMSDRGTIVMSLPLLAERWNDRTVNRIHVDLAPGVPLERVRADIAARLGARHRLKILSLREMMDYHDVHVMRAFALTDAIQLLVAIVTIAGIFDLLTSSIVERRRELALWRVIGADDRAVRRSIVIESATVGLVGAVLGVAVGFVTAWIWVAVNFRYLLGYYLEFHFAWRSAAWYVLLVVAMTMLAGRMAAVQAVRASVLRDIREG